MTEERAEYNAPPPHYHDWQPAVPDLDDEYGLRIVGAYCETCGAFKPSEEIVAEMNR